MTALEQGSRELREGKRLLTDVDELWAAASREQADREFEAYVRPQREYVARLRGYDPYDHARAAAPRPGPNALRRSVFKPVRFGT